MLCEDNATTFTNADILIPNVVYAVLVMLLHFGLLAFYKDAPFVKTWKGKNGEPLSDAKKLEKMITFIQGMNALVTSIFVTAIYAWGFYSLDGSRESRWHGNNIGLMHALSLHVALTLYDTWLYIVYFPDKGIEFHTHHVMVLATAFICLGTGRGSAWGAWFGVVEITNAPLTGITVLPMMGLKGGTLHTISGTMLWVLFLMFRIINVPWGLYTFATDVLEEGGAGGKARYVEAETSDLMNQTFVWFTGLSAFFLFGISSLWFFKITKGLVKVLTGGGGDNAKKSK